MAPITFLSALSILPTLLNLVPGANAQNTTNLNFTLVTSNLSTIDIYYTPPQLLTNGTRLTDFVPPQQKRISYSNVNGLAIVEGDIILTTVEDLRASAVRPPAKLKSRGLSIQHTDKLRKWPDGVLLYKYETQAFKDEKKVAFDMAVKLWQDLLPQIRFREASAPNNDNIDNGGTITLRGSHASPDYCKECSFSPVGRAGWNDNRGVWHYNKEANQLILGPCSSLESCAGIYAHELGHSLGLYHEHMRPDRDDNVIVNCNSIRSGVDASGATVTPDCSDERNCRIGGCAFVKKTPAEVDYSGPYDRNSIMHYFTTAFSKGGTKTITGKPPFADPKPGNKPTLLDAQKVCNLYSEVCRAVCGDGVLSPGEVCDDGNNIDGDGCSADCQSTGTSTTPKCGNGIVEKGEDCDDGAKNGTPGWACDANCKKVVSEKRCTIQQCDPRPGENRCHITTSCIKIEGSTDPNRHLCACRHGFRGLGIDAGNTNGQARIPRARWPSQEGRVFVNPGTQCVQLCSAWTLGADGCKEVGELDTCFNP